MNRPLIMIAILLAVLAIVFWFTGFATNVGMVLLGAAVLLGLVGILTGK